MRWLLPVLFVSVVLPAGAQRPPSAEPCEVGGARTEIEGASVRATLFNNGNLFFGRASDAAQYVVPTDSTSPLYAANFWLAGTVGGEVRSASALYDNFAFRPGLTGPGGTAPTPDECADADRIWTVSPLDVETYNLTGAATRDLAEWPVTLGAPAVDGDGTAGNYNLAGGDRPALSGDVTAFWAMTDTASPSPEGSGVPWGPLGVDVTVEAFSFLLAPEALTSATFYRYTVTNRSGVTMDGLHVGLFVDFDLGNAGDDYLGTDTTRSMFYVYNGDNDDETIAGIEGYGPAPPAVGVVVLDSPDGPDGHPLGLTASHYFTSGTTPASFPFNAVTVLRRMQGRFNDGSPMREGGDGYRQIPSSPITTFLLPGDPVAGQFWSERNTDGTGSTNAPTERSGALASGPLTLQPDSTGLFLYGILYGRGTSHLNSVAVLREHASLAHTAQAIGRLDAVAAALPDPPDPPPFALRRPAPNPFTTDTEIAFVSAPAALALTVRVVDVLGREVERHAVPAGTSSVRIGARLAAGVYVVEVSGLGVAVPLTVVKAR